jgi:hypothetical protein
VRLSVARRKKAAQHGAVCGSNCAVRCGTTWCEQRSIYVDGRMAAGWPDGRLMAGGMAG